MAQVGYGPLWPVLGPPPEKPFATLRVVDEGDEHWLNGVKVYPFPSDLPKVHDTCASGSSRTKAVGGTVALPEYGGFAVYLAEKCSAFGIWGGGLSEEQAQDRFVARATAALAATEAFAVEQQFMAGVGIGNNPHLADGNGNFPNGDTAVSVMDAFAILEDEIAKTGRRGVIHCTPAMLTKAGQQFLVLDAREGEVVTINGTRVVPGYGYVGRTQAPGHAAPSAKQAYIYATGPIDVRRTAVEVVPGTVAQALDRSVNTISYLVERGYVVDWDTVLQSGVLADRSL
jgi:hypothetical protein